MHGSGQRKKIPRILGTVLFLLTVLMNGSGLAQTIRINADQQYDYAESLFEQGEYIQAVTEYERFLHFFPDDPRKREAAYRIGMAYFNSRAFSEAIDAFRRVIDTYDGSPLSLQNEVTEAFFQISKAYLALNQPGQAVANLQNLITLAENREVQDAAFHRIGWIYLEAGEWDRARFYLAQISPENRETYRLEKIADTLERVDEIPTRNPALAGTLSAVVPGSGYVYTGRYRDALISFLLNGGMILAAYTAFADDNPALGAVISFFEIGFYTGNIYGSIGSAHKYNRDRVTEFVRNLQQEAGVRFSAGPSPDGEGVAFLFRYSF